MARPRLPPGEKRVHISLHPHPEVLAWVDANIGVGKRWHNRTQAFEWCVAQVMAREGFLPGDGEVAHGAQAAASRGKSNSESTKRR